MRKNPSQARQYALQGFLLGLLPASLWSVYAENPFLPGKSGILTSFLAGTLLLAGCGLLFRNRKKGGLLISAGILLNLFLLFFDFLSNPLLTLFCLLLTAGAFYYLLTARLFAALQTTAELQLERVIGCSSAGVVLSLTAPLFTEEIKFLSLITSVNLFLLLFLIWKYCKLKEYFQHPKSLSLLLFLTIAGIGFLSWRGGVILTAFLTTPAILYFSLRHKHTNWKYLELIIAHPARCLFLTFLGLCIGGTLLLRTPWAMTGELSLSAAGREKLGSAIAQVTNCNRLAIQQAAIQAQSHRQAGAWGIVFMTILFFTAAIFFEQKLRRTLLLPLQEITQVIEARSKGDLFRRCNMIYANGDMKKLFSAVNALLDKKN